MPLTEQEIRHLACDSVRKELARLNALLLELDPPRRGRKPRAQALDVPGATQGGRKTMSAEARKAVSERMKKMWASRKREKK